MLVYPNYKYVTEDDETIINNEANLVKWIYGKFQNYYVYGDRRILKNTRRSLPRQYECRYLWKQIAKADFFTDIKEVLKEDNITINIKVTESCINRLYNVLKMMLEDNEFVEQYLSKNLLYINI